MTQDDMFKECRLDAKAFRENNTYDSDGNPIRLIAVADRLDTYANWIAATDAENQRLRAEVEALREALTAQRTCCDCDTHFSGEGQGAFICNSCAGAD